MKKLSLLKVSLLLLLLLIVSCTTTLDEEELTQQLEDVYDACENDGIDDIDSLENLLNSGGNNLSNTCRVALGNVDFSGIVDAFDISLDFEIPSPGKEINPLLTESSSWQQMNTWSTTDSFQYISTGLDFVSQSAIEMQGVDNDGLRTTISDFTMTNVVESDVAISYTTDYSGSMLESDIVAINEYFQDFHLVLPDFTPTNVTIFSDEVTAKTSGFITDAPAVNAALTFDSNYMRGSTALYDAWGDALTKLDAENKKLTLNVVATDGFENSSTVYTTRNALQQKIVDSNSYNIVIAALWAETRVLQDLVGDKGIVIYKYQIDEAQRIIADLKTLLSNIVKIQVNEDVSGYTSLEIIYSDQTKTSIALSQE